MPVTTLPVSYSSVGLVNSAFPAITSVSNLSSAATAQYVGMVEARINGKIAKRYSLPLTVECPLLTALATREAIYSIAVGRALIQFPPAQQGQHPFQIQHKEDMKLLDEIANGMIQLVDSSGANIEMNLTQIEIYSTTMDYEPTFHEGDWTDMSQDSDKVDDFLRDRGML